jgi:CBS domain containing-hemolysin-like protein
MVRKVVGEIDVGLDVEEYLPRRKRRVERLDQEVYLMDSRFPISEANEVLGTSLPATESHTIGGLVMARLRHIPKEGEFIEEAGCRFTVEQATERSVVKLRVERIGI